MTNTARRVNSLSLWAKQVNRQSAGALLHFNLRPSESFSESKWTYVGLRAMRRLSTAIWTSSQQTNTRHKPSSPRAHKDFQSSSASTVRNKLPGMEVEQEEPQITHTTLD